ncbi:Uncharacterised protein [uncultured archaeon]|nr:Uncharacterised protein [uncultured archaeon]
MAEIKKIVKIKKQSYRFELRRKYSNRKKYKVKQETIGEKLLVEAKKALAPKRAPGAGPAQPGRNPLILLGAVILVIALLIAIFPPTAQQQPLQQRNFTKAPPSLSLSINESGVASLGSYVKGTRAAFYKMQYSAGNADSLTVQTATYSERMPNQIFMLVSKMDGATSYPQFKNALKRLLDGKGLPLNEISLEQAETLPEGSLLIVPSGMIPERLVKPGGANLATMLKRGVDVLYIGQRFDQAISETGAPVRITDEDRSSIPFTFETASLSSNSSLHLTSSLYRVRSNTYAGTGLLYGVISVGQIGRGTILFVPQTLDSGWGGTDAYSQAAGDIATIISEMGWAAPESQQNQSAQFADNKTFYSFFVSPQFDDREKQLVVRAVASGPTGTTERIRVIYPRADTNGDLYFVSTTRAEDEATKLVSARVTGSDTKFLAELRENTSAQRNLYLSVKDVNGAELQPRRSIAPGSSGRVDLQGSPQFSDRLNLDEGTYLASVVDDANAAYARAILQVTGVDFMAERADFSRGIFTFNASADGQPVRIQNLRVSVDGKYNFTYSGQSEYEISLESALGGQPLAAGNHTFAFTFNDVSKTVALEKTVSSNFWDNPLIWILGVISALLFLGAPFLALVMRKVEYSLDIPDFPPLASMKIPMKKDAVLGIIEKVNEDYKWKQTPLTLEEIKKGFKKIIYQSKPVFISDYNLEYILEKLETKGEVKGALDYYGLAKWEQESNRSIRFLAIQRKIRDICINEAIPFSKPGESKDYDINLKVLGQDVFTYVMDSPEKREEKLSEAIRMISRGLVVLLFENFDAKKDFEDTINTSSESGGMVKLEIMAGSIVPLTINEFEKMLKEMKTI